MQKNSRKMPLDCRNPCTTTALFTYSLRKRPNNLPHDFLFTQAREAEKAKLRKSFKGGETDASKLKMKLLDLEDENPSSAEQRKVLLVA